MQGDRNDGCRDDDDLQQERPSTRDESPQAVMVSEP